MYAAYAEAAGSACMSRQVGAAIVSDNGEVIGLGKNDVARFGGGLYTSEDGDADHRCFRWANNICHNDDRKAQLYGQVWKQLSEDGLVTADVDSERAVSSIATTELKQLIEFSRAVHAEMEAIISVARGGKNGLVGSTLYCTTYPCHSCARHILAAGVKRVVYIEPYPKSLAMTLHYDAVSESEEDDGKKLVFLQYSGVAPKHMLRLFKASKPRKDEMGRCIVVSRKSVIPLLAVPLDDFATHEKYVVARLAQSEAAKKGNAQPKLV
jgi:deoxycytidylate deaminase